MSDCEFDFSQFRFIKLRGDGSKLPAKSWGGYDQDFDAAEHVHTHEEVEMLPAENWGVVDVEDPAHGSFALLIFDIDVHKAPEDFDVDRVSIPNNTLVTRSQNGGFHVYFVISGCERSALNESDFSMAADPGFDVDIRGSAVSHHVVAPADIPGIGGQYEVVNNEEITTYFEPREAAERIQLDGEPLLEFNPDSSGAASYDFDVPTEAPDDMPTCYHAGLELRKAAPDDHPNSHKVNVLTAACGLGAGYDAETVAGHFCGEWAPHDGGADISDQETTEYQVRHIDTGGYAPPSEQTLRDYGILDEDQHCDEDCPIDYHGPTNKPRPSLDMGDSGPTTDGGRDWSLNPLDVLELAVQDPMHPADYDEDGAYDVFPRDLRTNERGNYVWTLAKKADADDIIARRHGPLLAYQPETSVWKNDDEQRIREIAKESLGSAFSKGVVDEVEANIRADASRVKDPDQLGAPDESIMTPSGLLHLRDRRIEDGKREHYAVSNLPHQPDWEAECPRWEDFVNDAIETNAELKKFQEYCGYTLWRHAQTFGKAMLLVGPTDSGKSTALKVIRHVLGNDNVASESLQNLIDTRWGKAQLVGNIANIREEVTPSGLQSVEAFKEITGGEGKVTAEYKGQKKFDFVVTQKLMFATNEVPSVQDADEAFYNRLLFVRFPNTVDPEDQDPELAEKLKSEAPGILNWMLDGLDRLLEQQAFTGERAINGKKELCDAFGGVIDRFTHNCLMITGNDDDVVSKSDLHDLAHHYADDIDKDPDWGKQTGFTQELSNQRGIGQSKRRIDGQPTDVLTGVRVKPEVVYRFDMDLRAKCEDIEDSSPGNLRHYQSEEIRPGYDTREERQLVPLIIKTLRESDERQLSHEELVDELTARGVDESKLESKIEKAKRQGDITEPRTGLYRPT